MKDLKLSIIVCLFFSLLIISCKKKEDSTTDSKTNSPISTGCGGISTVTDIDGNIYNVIQIGNQCWLKENLRTSHYQNGDPINSNLTDQNWKITKSGAFAIYGNNAIYGNLYNLYAVSDARQICPQGFHIPTSTEWDDLIIYLGGINLTGTALKSTNLWTPQSGITSTNSTGFTALPSGVRDEYGGYSYLGDMARFWSSTTISGFLSAYDYTLYYSSTGIIKDENYRQNAGYSCRCVAGPSQPMLYLGKSYQGGTIVYVDPSRLHGRIAAQFNQSDSIFWHSTSSGLVGANSIDGAINTKKIVAFYGAEVNAASICENLVLNGYSDWYLPSFEDLIFSPYFGNDVWTSTETAIGSPLPNGSLANFGTNQIGVLKATKKPVRAFRKF